MFIDFDSFNQHLDQLLPGYKKDDIANKFLLAYSLYERLYIDSHSITADFNPNELSNELIAYLFRTNSSFFAIPNSFIDSPVGNVLFSLKFGFPEVEFSAAQSALILGVSKSLISIDKENKKFFSTSTGKITKPNLIKYMESRGFSSDIAIKRINTFIDLKNRNLSNTEIKTHLNAIRD